MLGVCKFLQFMAVVLFLPLGPFVFVEDSGDEAALPRLGIGWLDAADPFFGEGIPWLEGLRSQIETH